jgi:hypothetical protein
VPVHRKGTWLLNFHSVHQRCLIGTPAGDSEVTRNSTWGRTGSGVGGRARCSYIFFPGHLGIF